MSYYKSIRPYIFKLDCEKAHALANAMCQIADFFPPILSYLSQKTEVENNALAQNIDGMHFYNPIGLAAGFDKNATMIRPLCALGFSHLELGAVTPQPQNGNPKPRVWRHIKEESIQNAMGFNNEGSLAISKRIQKLYPFSIPLGINIGKNKTTPDEKALEDYIKLAKDFATLSDYLSINISSPNTPNLRALQNKSFIKELLLELCKVYKKPIYLKLAPDLAMQDILELSNEAISKGAKGIIATNTTLDYSLVPNPKEMGGLSGAVLKAKSLEITKELGKILKKKATLISVGGIASAKDAYERILYGASLVQIYTAFIYEGPFVVKKMQQDLLSLLQQDGFNNISLAVGAKL
ncbi:quinone-dependent dihydroorotate dehydrogenase [Helicobacter burdigaliensis]|uniref:quinone-dependent dihydroorotate dehydrogenase n=1 Tax=Helicobacter burdigaliensis TaxID=2315334 RepID=UPI000EF66A5D|nr:quinone-dependent dihydroorotate dehydrogenase [Helicobacter burdigaliensis]